MSDALGRAVAALIGALRMGRKALTCGDPSPAEFMAARLLDGGPGRRPLAAVALGHAAGVPLPRQIAALGCQGDVLALFAASSSDAELRDAIAAARRIGMPVVACGGGESLSAALGPFDFDIREATPLATAQAICDAVFAGGPGGAPDKIQPDWDTLAELVRGLRPLAFTNGVFDILHRGHVHSLKRARDEGAWLVVGVNSDASVRRLGKGEDRPIQSEDDRAAILAGLGCVDFVTIFDDDTPAQLIRRIAPDVLVKGGDYQPHQIAGADFVIARGGRVVTIPFEHDRSTTQIVRKIAGGAGIH